MASSALQLAKRALVRVLLALAHVYNIAGVSLKRDSADALLESAFRKVVKRVHPDKGGKTAHAQELQAARDKWMGLRCSSDAGSAQQQCAGTVVATSSQHKKTFRIRSLAVMLTYSGVKHQSTWRRFLRFIRSHLPSWLCQYWCATMEGAESEDFHFHLMLQFWSPQRVLT